MTQLQPHSRRGSPRRPSQVFSGLLALGACLAVSLGLATPAVAQKACILTAVRSGENGWWQQVKARIVDTGLYPDGVEQKDLGFRDPSLSELTSCRLLVMIASDYGYSTSDGLGNAVGDFMATVPGAAVLVFQPYTFQTNVPSAPPIGGRFLTNYALTNQGSTDANSATKRGMFVAADPLMANVDDFDCGTGCKRLTGTMPKAGATVAAYWADGSILAVRGKRRVDLNMMPADDSVITGSWNAKAGRIITNAIVYLSSPMKVRPQQIDFDDSPLGAATDPETVTFTNIYSAPVKLTGLGLDGTGRAHFAYDADKIPTPAAPITVVPGGTYRARVVFKPQIQGTHKAAFYLNLQGFERTEIALTGSSRGNLYVSLSPLNFGGVPLGTAVGPYTVRLKNMGTTNIEITKPEIGDTTNYDLTTAVPDAKVTMLPGATYAFDVKMKAAAVAGEFATDVTVESTDTGSPLVIPVIGRSGPPKLKVPYTSLLLSDTPTGAKALPLEVMLFNEGFSELQVTSITSDVTDFEIPNGPSMMTPIKIPAKSGTVFQLVFSPSGSGLRSGKLTIKSNEPAVPPAMDSDKVISLSGNGTKPKFRVAETALDFGTADIGAAVASQQVNLFNEGDGDLVVKDVSIIAGMGSDSFAVSTLAPVPFVLRAGTSMPLTVDFTPRMAGMLGATLRIVTDLAMSGSATVDLKGLANGAVGKLDPGTLAFGDQKVKSMVVKTVTISNNGNRDLTILRSRVVPAAGSFAAMLPPDGTKVNPGKSLAINVTSLPGMAGAANARIELETDDPAVAGGTQFIAQLTVNGVVPGVTVSPVELTFDPLLVGRKSDMKVVKVTNSGSVAIDNLAASISGSQMGNDAGDFGYITGFKTKLMPGDSTDIGVYFEPRVAKAMHYATLVLNADGVMVPMTVALKGSSMAAAIVAQPALLKFSNTFLGSTTEPKAILLSNEGAQSIELEIVAPTSEDFVVDLSSVKTTLGMGDSTRVPVQFAPKTTGMKAESVEIRLKGTQVSLAKIDLEGLGVAMPPPKMEGGCSMAPRSGSGLPLLGLSLLGLALLVLRRRRAL
ncbi:MAG TPA: choice-of-anchor D domain-containing protein [Pseudomonadota bacterium]|nr:choice-of-anchor D domain-containing protein [Pseudomonadota bacterium]